MFRQIYIEKDLLESPISQKILAQFPNAERRYIDSYQQVFGKYRKPYLQKRQRLDLFIARKKGTLLKTAPDAYGLAGEPHYYYIHAYNCIYECEYCYLQGYFDSPDIVIFVNHEDILFELEQCLQQHPQGRVWFHAGEFSDSLALSHLSGELEAYQDFFRQHPRAQWELRTKSANVRSLLKLTPLPNRYTSFSLAPRWQTEKLEHKTASLKARLQAMAKLHEAGHKIAVHFDPIVYQKFWLEEYHRLIKEMQEYFPLTALEYVSLGVVRFTKEVLHATQNHYPDSEIFQYEMLRSFDGKIRYPKPMRMHILTGIEALLQRSGLAKEKIYLCME